MKEKFLKPDSHWFVVKVGKKRNKRMKFEKNGKKKCIF